LKHPRDELDQIGQGCAQELRIASPIFAGRGSAKATK
jgi:hypothetical protein